MRKKWKGQDIILLSEDTPGGFETGGGFTSIDEYRLHSKMSELYSDEALITLADDIGVNLAAIRNMPLIAVIKSNMAGSNSMGWHKHKQVLKDTGFDV